MKIKNTLTKTLLIAFAGLCVSACTPKLYYKTQNNVSTVKQQVDQRHIDADKQAKNLPDVEVNDGLFVDSTTIDLKTQPAWLQKKISLHGDKLPFSFYSRNVVRSANVLTKYQYGLNPATTVSMNYTGNIKGALDLLAAKTGYVYDVDGDLVSWQAFVTKTFEIAFMPGSSNYMVGKEQSGSGAAVSSGKGGAQVVVNGNSGSSSHQYSNLEGKLSIWADIEKTINAMLSPEGKVVVSESTTSVTVHDHPTNVKTIAEYLRKLNVDLSQQVMIKIKILEISLNDSFSNGINWSLMKTMISGTKFKFDGDFTAPISLSPIAGITKLPTLGVTATNGSSALISALSQQGRVSISTEPTVVTTNNQMASVNITSQQGYIAKLSSTLSGSSSNLVTTEITPGQVNTGLTLFLLPKIMDGKVYLQVSSSLSTLQKIDDLFSTGETEGANATKIQAPVLSGKDFNQRSVITSGTTLILAGYKQLSNEANNSAEFQIDKLGGRGAVQRNTQTIVLITPYILDHS